MAELTEYERGLKEGRVDALLDEHTQRLNKINGSVERFAKSNEEMAKALREGLELQARELRKLQEEGRARDLAVKVAADTLATETERRREELATAAAGTTTAWSLRSNKATVIYAVAAIILGIAAIYFALPHK
jgi:hypothetical protein